METTTSCMHLEFVDSTSNDWLFGEDVLVIGGFVHNVVPLMFLQFFAILGTFR